MLKQPGLVIFTVLFTFLTSCSFNPFREDNHLTGSATSTAVGATAGGLAAYFANASKAEIGLAAVAGGAVGYYVSTLRFASGGVMQTGGQVFAVGEYVTIEIPTDILFDVNSADFIPGASNALDSAILVLQRNPCNNILISGNTSGFGSAKFQRKLSEERAKQVSAYLWAHGINNFEEMSKMRKLTYVGYGNYFPIANHYKADSIRQNSRIQITSYPSKADLGLDKKSRLLNNVGAYESSTPPQDEHLVTEPVRPNTLSENPPVSTKSDLNDLDLKNETWE